MFFFYIGEWGLNSKCQPVTFSSSQIVTPRFRKLRFPILPKRLQILKWFICVCEQSIALWFILAAVIWPFSPAVSEYLNNSSSIRPQLSSSSSSLKVIKKLFCRAVICTSVPPKGIFFLAHPQQDFSNFKQQQSVLLLILFFNPLSAFALYQPTWTVCRTSTFHPLDKVPIRSVLMRR